MKVLVTGGAGYIGAHTVKMLKNAGHQVVIFDNFSKGHRDFIQGTALIEGDLRSKDQIEKVFQANKYDAVMHFAAKMEVKESEEDPGSYYENNVNGSINLLEAMRANGVNCLIFSSTAAVYSESNQMPLKEDSQLLPLSVYGKTKLIVENILHDYYKAYKFSSVILRYFNASGASTDNTIGESHNPETHLIPKLITNALTEKVSTIFGNDYPTPDGSAIRDYVHVMDIAQAHILALEYAHFEKCHETFNIGTGHGYSVKQVIQALEELLGKEISIQYGPRRDGDQPATYASIDKIKNVLGWEPKYSELATILQTAYHWHQKKH